MFFIRRNKVISFYNMKIRKKDRYVFKENTSYDVFQYQSLSNEELHSFIEDKIFFSKSKWYFEGNNICSYLQSGTVKSAPVRDMFIQTNKCKCVRLYYKNNKINIEDCYYNNPDLKCYLIGK